MVSQSPVSLGHSRHPIQAVQSPNSSKSQPLQTQNPKCLDVTGILHNSRNELIIRHVFAHHPAATCFATAQRPQLGDVFIESFQPKNTGGDTQPVGGPGLQIIASAPGSVRVWARALGVGRRPPPQPRRDQGVGGTKRAHLDLQLVQ